ncbi:MAG: type III-A CRISPR-associated RAMP protein Csm5 [Acutalibacteraceae bacterium]
MDRFLNYKLTVETLGPLFIGSDENKNIAKSEYVIIGNKLYVFDTKKMFNGLIKYHLDKEYTQYVLQYKYFNLESFLINKQISPDIYKQWTTYSLLLPNNVEIKSNISAFTKDAYSQPYVPGSSVKGAIRGAVLNALLLNGENRNFATETEKTLKIHQFPNGKQISRKDYLSSDSAKIENAMFNTLGRNNKKISDAVNSIFQGLTISDSEPISTDCLILCPKIDILPTKLNSANHLNVVRECIKPGTQIIFSVNIDRKFFPYDANQILDFIRQNYLNIEKKYLSSFPATVNPNDKYKIYLGGGSGFVSKTCIYTLFDEKNRAVKNSGEILDHVHSKKGSKNNKIGNHIYDFDKYGVAPHTRKSTTINGKNYDFGLCKIGFEQTDTAKFKVQ